MKAMRVDGIKMTDSETTYLTLLSKTCLLRLLFRPFCSLRSTARHFSLPPSPCSRHVRHAFVFMSIA